jgi:hypothetical protein
MGLSKWLRFSIAKDTSPPIFPSISAVKVRGIGWRVNFIYYVTEACSLSSILILQPLVDIDLHHVLSIMSVHHFPLVLIYNLVFWFEVWMCYNEKFPFMILFICVFCNPF